jgi:hypothetical protein
MESLIEAVQSLHSRRRTQQVLVGEKFPAPPLLNRHSAISKYVVAVLSHHSSNKFLDGKLSNALELAGVWTPNRARRTVYVRTRTALGGSGTGSPI